MFSVLSQHLRTSFKYMLWSVIKNFIHMKPWFYNASVICIVLFYCFGWHYCCWLRRLVGSSRRLIYNFHNLTEKQGGYCREKVYLIFRVLYNDRHSWFRGLRNLLRFTTLRINLHSIKSVSSPCLWIKKTPKTVKNWDL